MWTLVVVGILVALLIGFFVAAACGYMAGLIGTSCISNPPVSVSWRLLFLL